MKKFTIFDPFVMIIHFFDPFMEKNPVFRPFLGDKVFYFRPFFYENTLFSTVLGWKNILFKPFFNYYQLFRPFFEKISTFFDKKNHFFRLSPLENFFIKWEFVFGILSLLHLSLPPHSINFWKTSVYVGQPPTTTLHTFALSNLFEVSF